MNNSKADIIKVEWVPRSCNMMELSTFTSQKLRLVECDQMTKKEILKLKKLHKKSAKKLSALRFQRFLLKEKFAFEKSYLVYCDEENEDPGFFAFEDLKTVKEKLDDQEQEIIKQEIILERLFEQLKSVIGKGKYK